MGLKVTPQENPYEGLGINYKRSVNLEGRMRLINISYYGG
jgi:hypothetical protein